MNELLVLPLSAACYSKVMESQDLPMVQVHPDAVHVTDWVLYLYEEDTISWGATSDGWEEVKEGTLWRKPKTLEFFELADEMRFPLSYASDVLDAMGVGPAVAMPYLDTVAIHHAWEGDWNQETGMKAAAAGRRKLFDHPLLQT